MGGKVLDYEAKTILNEGMEKGMPLKQIRPITGLVGKSHYLF